MAHLALGYVLARAAGRCPRRYEKGAGPQSNFAIARPAKGQKSFRARTDHRGARPLRGHSKSVTCARRRVGVQALQSANKHPTAVQGAMPSRHSALPSVSAHVYGRAGRRPVCQKRACGHMVVLASPFCCAVCVPPRHTEVVANVLSPCRTHYWRHYDRCFLRHPRRNIRRLFEAAEQSCERHGMKHDMRPVPRTNR
jgi:hypothetical protein